MEYKKILTAYKHQEEGTKKRENTGVEEIYSRNHPRKGNMAYGKVGKNKGKPTANNPAIPTTPGRPGNATNI